MTFNAITPTNLGETIERDVLDQKKWDVKFDENHFEFTVNGIHLKDKVTEPLEDVDILDASLEGTTLKLEQVNGRFIEIPMEGIIPEPSKDIHLKAVNYNTQNKTLTFVTGETANETSDKSFTIDVSDLIPVTASNGIQGNGTSSSPLSVKLAKDSKLQVDTAGVNFAMLGTWELVDSTGNNLLGAIMPGSTTVNTSPEVGGGVDGPRGVRVLYEGVNTQYHLTFSGSDELTDHPIVLGRIEYFVTEENRVFTARYRITNFYPDDPNSKIALNPTAYNESLDYRIVVGSTSQLPTVEHTDENDPEFDEHAKGYLEREILRKGVTAEQYLQAIHDAKSYHDIDRNANEGILFTFDASRIDRLLTPILIYEDPDEYDYDVSTRYCVKTINGVDVSVDGSGNRNDHDGRVIICDAGKFNDQVEVHHGRIPSGYEGDMSKYYALAYDDISWREDPEPPVFPRSKWAREDATIEIMGKTIQVRNGAIDHISREQLIEWFWETGQTTASVPYKVISSSGKTLYEDRINWWDPTDEEELRERGIDFNS